MGNQTALIFGAVGYPDWSFLAPLRAAAAVFCADGGVNHVQAAGFSPDYYIGDGDSGGVPPAGIPAVQLPVHKDLTDLQAAWEQAFSLGFRKILLTGCTRTTRSPGFRRASTVWRRTRSAFSPCSPRTAGPSYPSAARNTRRRGASCAGAIPWA